ncbi:o-succinylbenzoate synthase [Parendozoicomonas sp. Alg238-R29]|uniref:o-succinylbenzoate synthase n=1 Tax=Parendozoicomonas sp. Alg238-R29 TaxID=2993446 RepID=UPI00248EEBAD|nr:o-succinylbenzoate synthase [Parendozoicomonas sp. Alg238-R29]
MQSFDMKVSVYQWSLPLSGSLPGCPDGERQGLLLWLEKDEGDGLGDCAPLPGFSQETLTEAKDALVTCARLLAENPAMFKDISEHGLQNTIADSLMWPSSVIFAVESAVDELDFTESNSLYHPEPSVCRLLAGDNQQVLSVAKSVESETKLVKVKVSRQSVTDDIALVEQLDSCLPDDVEIRLDGNRRWNLNQALEFSKAIPRNRISFIEEPLAEVEQLPEYVSKGGLPVALDESLHTGNIWGTGCPGVFDGLAALVVKPTLAGGVYRCRQLAEFARMHKLELVISSSYESNIGIGTLVRLAESVAPCTASGLDTLSVFQKRLVHGSQGPCSETAPLLLREQQEFYEKVVLREQLQLIWSSYNP